MILHDPSVRGPHDPVLPAPPRQPGSIRRTSTIDTNRPDGLTGPSVVSASARDLCTAVDGTTAVLGEASVHARLSSPDHRLLEIHARPDEPALGDLVGRVVGPGFRARVDACVPHLRDTGALLYLLLDDLPGATLVSGYAMLHADAVTAHPHDEYLDARADLCAGWARDGSMMTLVKRHGRSPVPLGPPAPPLARDDDPLAWHAMADLGPLGMRRLRRLDVGPVAEPGAPIPVDVFFRDTHVDAEMVETVVHEYSVTVTIDPVTRTIRAIEARADVLPWRECPAAVASATRLVGRPLAGLRRHVREQFVGTSTCTHLNDVLRGLADVDALVDALAALAR